MNKTLTKEILYPNGIRLIYNEQLRIWESRRESRTKQFDDTQKSTQPIQAIQRIPATLTLKPLENKRPKTNSVDVIVGNDSDDDSEIEVVFDSSKPISPPQIESEPKPFRNVSANLTLKQIANNSQPLKRFADDEIEVEVIRNSNRVQTHGSNAHYKVIRPAAKPSVNPHFASLFELQQRSRNASQLSVNPNSPTYFQLQQQRSQNVSQPSITTFFEMQQRLKNTNVTLTQSSTSESIGVPTQSIPVKPRVLIKPSFANKASFVARPPTPQITLRASVPPPTNQITLRAPALPTAAEKVSTELRKSTIKYKKCAETTLVCVVCKCVFLNPGSFELEYRLYGRFCCRKCNQFLNDCCDGLLDYEKFQCFNNSICDIGGDERCYCCWFDQAFIALNVSESQQFT